MICSRCGRPVAGLIDNHICKVERVEKIKRFGMLILNDGENTTRWCKSSDVEQLEKENEELRESLESIVSCIGNPWTGYQEAIEYAYETAMKALGEDV